MVLPSGLQSEGRAVNPSHVCGPAVGSRDRQSSAATVPGNGECACGPPHVGRAHAILWGAARDPGACPVLSPHPRLPRCGQSPPFSLHQVIGRGGYAPLTPYPLESGLGHPRLWPLLQAHGCPQWFPQRGHALVTEVGHFHGLEQPCPERELCRSSKSEWMKFRPSVQRASVRGPSTDTELGRQCWRAAVQGRPGRPTASRRSRSAEWPCRRGCADLGRSADTWPVVIRPPDEGTAPGEATLGKKQNPAGESSSTHLATLTRTKNGRSAPN